MVSVKLKMKNAKQARSKAPEDFHILIELDSSVL